MKNIANLNIQKFKSDVYSDTPIHLLDFKYLKARKLPFNYVLTQFENIDADIIFNNSLILGVSDKLDDLLSIIPADIPSYYLELAAVNFVGNRVCRLKCNSLDNLTGKGIQWILKGGKYAKYYCLDYWVKIEVLIEYLHYNFNLILQKFDYKYSKELVDACRDYYWKVWYEIKKLNIHMRRRFQFHYKIPQITLSFFATPEHRVTVYRKQVTLKFIKEDI